MTHGFKRAALIAALLLSAWPSLARDASKAPVPVQFKLANGMDVLVIEDRRAPVVTHMVWYKVGGADETPGKSGIAHFLEHLLFKGTKKHPKGEFDRIIARAGGEHNAFTSHDVTVYHQQVPKDRLGLMMELEADRMASLILGEKEVLSERDVILEERNQSVDSQPAAILGEQVAAALYSNHRYGVPVLGWRHEMAGLTHGDALAFYQRYYAPNNAILVVAGDVTAAAVKTMAEQYYGPLKPRVLPARVRPREPEPVSERRIAMKDARVSQAQWSRSYLATNYRLAKMNPDTAADGYVLDLFAQVLGGGTSSILYRALAEEQKLAVSISASFYGGGLDEGYFSIDATPAPGISLARLESHIGAVLEKTLRNGIQDADLTRARTRFISDTIFARDGQATQAESYGQALAAGLDIADVADWPERMKSVTRAQIEAAARKYLTPARAVTALLEPADGPSGKAAAKPGAR